MATPHFPLVDANWLNRNIKDARLIVLDASTYDQNTDLSNIDCIPNAIHFDLKKAFSDQTSNLPNTIPTVEQFENNCRALGITNKSKIVVYDNKGVYTSPRVWWLFKTMGHEEVYVLNGGLSHWQQQNYPLGKLTVKTVSEGDFTAVFNSKNLKYFKDIELLAGDNTVCILDARSEGRFKGKLPEPRPELKSGSIPNSINLPYTSVLKNGYYKPISELEAIFRSLKLADKQLVFTCGSGITACIILLAADLVLANDKSVYDGSWTEWASLNKLFTA